MECSNPIAKNRLGYMVQEESGGDSKRGYSTNLNGTDRDSGWFKEELGQA